MSYWQTWIISVLNELPVLDFDFPSFVYDYIKIIVFIFDNFLSIKYFTYLFIASILFSFYELISKVIFYVKDIYNSNLG